MLLAELFLLVLAFVLVGCVSASEYIRLQREIDRLRYAMEFWYHTANNSAKTPEVTKPEGEGLPPDGHTIIVGQTGSGKTNIAMLEIARRIEDGQQLYMVDTKNELCPYFSSHAVECVGIDGAEELMRKLVKIADDRQKLFGVITKTYLRGCSDYRDFEEITGKSLPRVCLVLEELIVLSAEIAKKDLVRLLAIGRSSGVFVMAVAQQIKAATLDTNGIINFNNRIYTGRWNTMSFRCLFGDVDDEDLVTAKAHVKLGKGYAAVEVNGDFRMMKFERIDPRYRDSFIG